MRPNEAYCKVRDELNKLGRLSYTEILANVVKIASDVSPEPKEEPKKKDKGMTRGSISGEDRQEKASSKDR